MSRRKVLGVGALVIVIVGTGTAYMVVRGPDIPLRRLDGLTGNIDRGAYVARLSGCIACHTDARNNGAVLAGGGATETAFGTFYAPNITPHLEDGIGGWSIDDFSRALTAGLSPDGSHYFPVFPYAFYTRMSDQDIVDLWAAVNSVPPVASGPPEHELDFPYSVRAGVGLWKWLYLDNGELAPDPSRPESWNRGRYLALGPAHCGACHTPRDFLGGRQLELRWTGGEGPDGEAVPPITGTALSDAGWTEEDLAFALRTGIVPGGDAFGGSMAEVVRDGSQFWSGDDLSAIATYVFSVESAE